MPYTPMMMRIESTENNGVNKSRMPNVRKNRQSNRSAIRPFTLFFINKMKLTSLAAPLTKTYRANKIPNRVT